MDDPIHPKVDHSPQTNQFEKRKSAGLSITVVRDAFIIWLLAPAIAAWLSILLKHIFGKGFLVMLISCCYAMLMMIFRFALSAYLASPNRWRHLIQVAIGVWLLSGLEGLFIGSKFHTAPRSWLGIIIWVICVALMMLLGGALSYLFKKDGSKSKYLS